MVRPVLDSACRGTEAAKNYSTSNAEKDRRFSKRTTRRLRGLAAPCHAQSRRACCIYPSERLGGGLQFAEVVMGWPRLPQTNRLLGLLCDFLAQCGMADSCERDELQAHAMRPSRRRWMKWEDVLRRFCKTCENVCWHKLAEDRLRWADLAAEFSKWYGRKPTVLD